MLFYAKGSVSDNFSKEDLRSGLQEAMQTIGHRRKVLSIPPDYTRFHSFAGEIIKILWHYYGDSLTDVLPALGTHSPMTDKQIDHMFGEVPKSLFKMHDWRNDIVTLGEVPAEFVKKVSDGRIEYPWPAQVNRLVAEGGHDLILSVGQVVPHEVIGMANYNKNIFVGTGGPDGINKSHFLGAAYGIERILGRADTPVRRVLNYASEHFTQHLPIVYVLTVVARDESQKLVVRGLFIGDDAECFNRASELSLRVNFEILEKPLQKVVVYLDPSEFKSAWLGNKSIYRTRMAIADGGELIVLAPGFKEFGEDRKIDRIIRKYGYLTTPEVLQLTQKNADLKNNLSAAAHLIHGSSEKRFTVTYCPGYLTKEEIEGVSFNYGDLAKMLDSYNPKKLRDGFNKLPSGEEIYYISNPALGLWACKDRFK